MAAANDFPHQNILQNEDSTNKKRYRLLELYCGIGGMRYALDAAGIPYEVVAAVDIDPVVSAIYKHNFGSQGHYEKDILSFTSSDIENMKIDIITMSPPCQPFPRFGIKDFERIAHERTKSFLHILTILNELQRKPMYIVVENAMGFDSSKAMKVLLQTMETSGYRYQQFYLTPQPFGFPNSRCCYYLIAKLKEEQFSFIESDQLLKEMPDGNSYKLERPQWIHENIVLHPLKFFLELDDDDLERYLIPDRILIKCLYEFDIVDGDSTNSTRFTKGYHHYAERSGSVISTVETGEAYELLQMATKCPDRKEKLTYLKEIGLRYFTPREIANLLLFPDHFNFPPGIIVEQMYESLVSSMNVYVTSCLMKLLFQKQV